MFVGANDDRCLGNPIHAPAIGIDQSDIRPVKCLQEFVAEKGALAKQVVIRLEPLCNAGVIHNSVDATAQFLHLLVIGELHQIGAIVLPFTATDSSKGCPNISPSISDEILFNRQTLENRREINHPILLPPRL
jgi:hypothetical protein